MKITTRGKVNVDSKVDQVESNVYEENVQQRWRYKDQRQENLIANGEDSKSDDKMSTKGDGQTLHLATSSCGLQERKITSWGKVWESTPSLGSLPQENQILTTNLN